MRYEEADGELGSTAASTRRRSSSEIAATVAGNSPVFAQPKIGLQRALRQRQRSLESPVGAMEAVLSGFEFICCMSARTKSAEQREYAHLRDALARKQAEVQKLQEQCDALRRDGDAHTERYGAQYLQNASGTEETEEYTEDENAPPDAVARR